MESKALFDAGLRRENGFAAMFAAGETCRQRRILRTLCWSCDWSVSIRLSAFQIHLLSSGYVEQYSNNGLSSASFVKTPLVRP